MQLRSDHRYNFALGRGELWSAITAVEKYEQWWPWLREFDGRAVETGEIWSCAVRPQLPYVLRFRIRLEKVIDEVLVDASVEGDIAGSARLELTDRESGCEVRMTSLLTPVNRLLNAAATLAPPLARRGHDWVLETGASQFASRFGGQPES